MEDKMHYIATAAGARPGNLRLLSGSRNEAGSASVPGSGVDQETQERPLPDADEFDELRRRGYTGSDNIESMINFVRNALHYHAIEYTVSPYHSKRQRESLMLTIHRIPQRACNSITGACMVVVGNSETELWTKALLRLLPEVEYEEAIEPTPVGAEEEGGA